MTSYIQKDKLKNFIFDTLTDMRNMLPPIIEDRCPHCGIPIRYPVIAREMDIELFETMLNAAHAVMEKHGIVAHLFADIRTECFIQIAKKKSVG